LFKRIFFIFISKRHEHTGRSLTIINCFFIKNMYSMNLEIKNVDLKAEAHTIINLLI